MDERTLLIHVAKGVRFEKMCQKALTDDDAKTRLYNTLVRVFGQSMGDHFWLDFKYELNDADSFLGKLDGRNTRAFLENF